jgi:hypothetical protein
MQRQSPERYSGIFVGSKSQAQQVQALQFLGASMGILYECHQGVIQQEEEEGYEA